MFILTEAQVQQEDKRGGEDDKHESETLGEAEQQDDREEKKDTPEELDKNSCREEGQKYSRTP